MPLQVFCRNCAQYRNEWCKLKVDSPDPDIVRDCQYYRGMTNADRIRAMTDEEMASYITGVWYGFEELPGMCDVCDKNSVQNCGECWLDWLKQEAIT